MSKQKQVRVLDTFVFINEEAQSIVSVVTDRPMHKSVKFELCKPHKTGYIMLDGEEKKFSTTDNVRPLDIMLNCGVMEMLYERECVYVVGVKVNK